MAAFDSVEEIADAKAEIFTGIEAGGAAILNRDNPHFERLALAAEKAGAARIIGFGRHPDADARLEDVSIGPAGSAVRARIDGRPMSYAVGVAGMHMVMNSLAVLAAALFLGADLDSAAAALASFTAGKGRGERFSLKLSSGSAVLIDESYNANPGFHARRNSGSRPDSGRPGRAACGRSWRYAGTGKGRARPAS